MTTVMFTCVGQRVEIVEAFNHIGARTVATDTSDLAPALYKADVSELTPRFDEPGYLETIQALIGENAVDVILPLTDLDQLLLAEHRHDLDALVLLPPPDVVRRSNDKYLAHLFLTEAGIGSPETFLSSEITPGLRFPLFLKLRSGSGSAWTRTATNRAELDFYLRNAPSEPIAQRLCTDDEYSIDVFCDLEGRCVNAIPRTMLQSKAGETVKGETIEDGELSSLGRRVAERFGVVGPATIQCFREAEGLLVTDINLRFGGGFPLPTAAGSRYPEYVLALARRERLEPQVGKFIAGLTFTSYPTQIILNAGERGLRPAEPKTQPHY